MNANTELRWLKSYPEGIHWDAELPCGPVWALLEQAVAAYPENPAIDFLGHKMNYRELGDLVARAACGFQRLGVGPGVHVGLYLPNTPHYFIAFMGALRAGAIVVNYSPLDAERTLAQKIEDSETSVMVTVDLASLYPKMANLTGNSRLQTLVVGGFTEFAPGATPEQAGQLGPIAEVNYDEHCRSFASLLDNDGSYTAYPIDDPSTTLAVLQYTGGTTGAPKGAMLTHANLTASCGQLQAILGDTLKPGQERVLAVLPPFHIYALMINMLFSLRLAAEVYLHPRFDVETALHEIHNNRITSFPGVPTMFIGLLAHPLTAQLDLTSLKMCNSGGAPLPLEVQQRYQQVAGCALREGWGMTETSTTGTFTPTTAEPHPGSCGIPLPGARIRIAALDGSVDSLPPGEHGELCIAGANVTVGYWKSPEATAETMTHDGYLRTGDIAYMDEDGWVYIVDRTKDMILCSGYNVYPRIIEEAIYEHPSVEEVSVIGIDDPYRGQAPKAFIKLRAGAEAFDFATLQAFLEPRLGKHERLSAMEIRDALPRTPVGKLSKKELVDEERQKSALVSA